MTEKEINLKSILFLVIGILLLLSLVICIYIVNSERDLVSVEAKVVDVKKDENGTGKNDITVSYDIGETSYNYNFYYKDNIKVDDYIKIYYHENNINSVTTFKTTKFIFVCPIIGLFLCILSLFELFRQNKEDIMFKTAVIDISGDTQKLEIVTDDSVIKEYESLPEEQVEAEVKAIKKENKSTVKEKTTSIKPNQSEQSAKEENNEDWYIEVKDEQTITGEANQQNKEQQNTIKEDNQIVNEQHSLNKEDNQINKDQQNLNNKSNKDDNSNQNLQNNIKENIDENNEEKTNSKVEQKI